MYSKQSPILVWSPHIAVRFEQILYKRSETDESI